MAKELTKDILRKIVKDGDRDIVAWHSWLERNIQDVLSEVWVYIEGNRRRAATLMVKLSPFDDLSTLESKIILFAMDKGKPFVVESQLQLGKIQLPVKETKKWIDRDTLPAELRSKEVRDTLTDLKLVVFFQDSSDWNNLKNCMVLNPSGIAVGELLVKRRDLAVAQHK